jgi:hypothetical protein
LAVRILHSQEGSQDQLKAIQEAALNPELIRELAATHAEASDDALRSHLIVEKKFTEEGAKQLIRAFRDTFTLAKLKNSVYSKDEKNTESEDMLDEESPNLKRQREKLKELGFVTEEEAAAQGLLNAFPIRLSRQNQAVLRFTRLPVDKEDLKLIKSFIDLMEKTFTEPPMEHDA